MVDLAKSSSEKLHNNDNIDFNFSVNLSNCSQNDIED